MASHLKTLKVSSCHIRIIILWHHKSKANFYLVVSKLRIHLKINKQRSIIPLNSLSSKKRESKKRSLIHHLKKRLKKWYKNMRKKKNIPKMNVKHYHIQLKFSMSLLKSLVKTRLLKKKKNKQKTKPTKIHTMPICFNSSSIENNFNSIHHQWCHHITLTSRPSSTIAWCFSISNLLLMLIDLNPLKQVRSRRSSQQIVICRNRPVPLQIVLELLIPITIQIPMVNHQVINKMLMYLRLIPTSITSFKRTSSSSSSRRSRNNQNRSKRSRSNKNDIFLNY